ncbi:MAG TPA: SAM-dependent methyltransferase [Rhodobacteraceae bacterium]|jgi:2-polyprenyl-3-methyl-5-hydroxy-6-metoxy-1,4-benzoquinol methylase|nr:SAM-dependent methyltransferase [Paracoccaceae bacterium]
MWNERYEQPGYLFGTEPAQFLRDHSGYLKPDAKALAVADGEGRNSVFMAQAGLDVTAMDYSHIAIEKAKALAMAREVSVSFNEADINSWDWQENSFDLVVAIFIQFVGATIRDQIFNGIKRTLKPGGVLMLHGYTPEQIAFGTGGPSQAENMYTLEILERAFGGFEILELSAYQRDLDEGDGHCGKSALIDLVARKPK